MTDAEVRELDRCKEEIARLKDLVVQLAAIVVRRVFEDAQNSKDAKFPKQ